MIRKTMIAGLSAAILLGACLQAGFAAREVRERGDGVPGQTEGLEANRLFDKAKELIEARETERGIKLLESILDQYPASHAKYAAALLLGKYYLDSHEQTKAIANLNMLRDFGLREKELSPADRELYLEGQYLLGVTYFQMRQYGTVFPILRKITTNYPNTIWANQAYYYIGMCHFAQQNWSKAIEALNMVGMFVDTDTPNATLAEAGQRVYFKIKDADLPILRNIGQKTFVTVTTARGDKESAECIPVSGQSDVFIGSLPTEVGLPRLNDGIIQIVGGDAVTVEYVDLNTLSGSNSVPKRFSIRIVSTASLMFTLGDNETRASAAYLEQPVSVVLSDLDMDRTDDRDSTQVKVFSRYKEEEPEALEASKAVDVEKLMQGEQAKFKIRDEIFLKVDEQGEPPVHGGRFTGKFIVVPQKSEKPASTSIPSVRCAVGDEIVVQYTDEVHLLGESNRVIEAVLPVVGEIDNAPRISQDVVADPVLKARKYIVEATAYLELARIFQGMGLAKGAREKSVEGIQRVNEVIRTRTPIPAAMRQDAFKVKWELHMAADEIDEAIGTCAAFNALYPDSPVVDQALMGIARARFENKQYPEAARIFSQILGLPKSDAKAEAAFRIAEISEITSGGSAGAAIANYKKCAEQFPDSEYAGLSLSKVVDYYVSTKDYMQAGSLLEQVFQDYPDAKFLDSMLLKSVLVAFSAGDYQKAKERCSQLLFQYPNSPHAANAKKMMPKIEAQLSVDGGKVDAKDEKK